MDRAARLTRERQDEQRAYEEKKASLQEAPSGLVPMSEKFLPAEATQVSQKTYGLMTLEEFRKAKQAKDVKVEEPKKKKKKPRPEQKCLSFDEDEEDSEPPTKKKMGKCPFVATEFLPDAERDDRERREKERRDKEFAKEQEKMKSSELEVPFSFLDANDVPQHTTNDTARIRVGATIADFLRTATEKQTDSILVVFDERIIPHHLTFYDLVHHNAKGQSGGTLLVSESSSSVSLPPGGRATLVTRAWFDANKHIFPATRWVTYRPPRSLDQ